MARRRTPDPVSVAVVALLFGVVVARVAVPSLLPMGPSLARTVPLPAGAAATYVLVVDERALSEARRTIETHRAPFDSSEVDLLRVSVTRSAERLLMTLGHTPPTLLTLDASGHMVRIMPLRVDDLPE